MAMVSPKRTMNPLIFNGNYDFCFISHNWMKNTFLLHQENNFPFFLPSPLGISLVSCPGLVFFLPMFHGCFVPWNHWEKQVSHSRKLKLIVFLAFHSRNILWAASPRTEVQKPLPNPTLSPKQLCHFSLTLQRPSLTLGHNSAIFPGGRLQPV